MIGSGLSAAAQHPSSPVERHIGLRVGTGEVSSVAAVKRYALSGVAVATLVLAACSDVDPGFGVSGMPPPCTTTECVYLVALPPSGADVYTVESVEESPTEVEVEISPDRAEDNHAAIDIEVPLAEPLGNRTLVVNGKTVKGPDN